MSRKQAPRLHANYRSSKIEAEIEELLFADIRKIREKCTSGARERPNPISTDEAIVGLNATIKEIAGPPWLKRVLLYRLQRLRRAVRSWRYCSYRRDIESLKRLRDHLICLASWG